MLVDNGASVVEVLVDELAVLNVDQGGKEDDGGADESQAPDGGELDEEVGQKGGGKGL